MLGRITLAVVLCVTGGRAASGQQVPTQEAVGTPPAPVPSAVPPAASTTREAELEARIRQLEAMVNGLSTQVRQLSTSGAAGPVRGANAPPATPSNPDTTAGGPAPRGTASPDTGTAATTVAPSASGGAAAPGQSLPPNPPPSARFNVPATLDSIGGNFKFGPGFELRSNDDEYIFQFHDLTQLDYRGYFPNSYGNGGPVKDTFGFPRQWFMFSGRVSKPFGYFVSIAQGFDTLNLLDCFLDVDYDPRLRLRIGRYKTPFTYEFFVEPIQGLVVPERSVFFNNFALNRSNGVMGFGRLFENRIDWAASILNAARNSLLDTQNAKAVAAYMNYRPFAGEENTLLENFNVGGSVYAGQQNSVPGPLFFRTIVPTSGNPLLGTEFLGLNTNVRADGVLAYWDLHMAWYYRQLAVIGEWGSGFQDYSTNAAALSPTKTRLPVESFYIQASYFLTGETRSSIGIVKPNSPFDIRKGKFGIGAWEPYFRFEYLDISQKVFTQGLADPNQWANRLWDTHVGINWHLTQYVKMYFDWNYDWYNQNVFYAPNRHMRVSDLFLWRIQLYF
jgi:phosphate-selective porin OprO/OprP